MRPATTTIVKDSLVIHERVVHDTAYFQVPVEVEKVVTRDTLSRLENSLAVSEALVRGGELTHILKTKARRIEVPVPVIVRDTIRIQSESVTIEVPVEKNLTSWQKARMWLGDVAIGAMIICLILLIIRVVKRFKGVSWSR